MGRMFPGLSHTFQNVHKNSCTLFGVDQRKKLGCSCSRQGRSLTGPAFSLDRTVGFDSLRGIRPGLNFRTRPHKKQNSCKKLPKFHLKINFLSVFQTFLVVFCAPARETCDYEGH